MSVTSALLCHVNGSLLKQPSLVIIDGVRRLLGRPAKAQSFALKEEEVWDWRFADGQEIKVFSVTFDKTGTVVGTAITPDPKEIGQLGK